MEKSKVSLWISIAFALVCAVLFFKVNVNSDMTKYLPDNSKMRQGLEILRSEFDASALSVPEIRVVFKDLEADAADSLRADIAARQGVSAVTAQTSGAYTLFEISVEPGVNQKRLARNIDGAYLTQTAQDGNTPDPKALVFAIIALIIILLVMSRSWLEPVLFLATTGMAVLVNVGTNAFLPSVSITTNSIAAVLQLALSMDYSIILMNRYRQVKQHRADKCTAMNAAIRTSLRSISTSAGTTMVGLLMLCFMNLKIGADMGIVLAKGVFCSYVYAFTALPGLILIFDKAIDATAKKVPTLPTDGIADFVKRFRIPLAVLFVVISAGSYILHNRTVISFSTNFETPVDSLFPRDNAIILVYSNADEASVCDVLDSAAADSCVNMAISYPSLMLRQMTAGQMTARLKELGGEQAAMLDESLLRAVYYTRYADASMLRLSFPELVSFIKQQSETNPLIASYMGPEMKEKMAMLDAVTGAVPAFDGGYSAPAAKGPSGPLAEDPAPASEDEILDSATVARLSDTTLVRKQMTTAEMTAFIGSTAMQTKMVYSMSGNSGKTMSPLEFAHFLVDDIFNRKALASMINADQRAGMTLRLQIMEAADSGRPVAVPAASPAESAAPQAPAEPADPAASEDASPADAPTQMAPAPQPEAPAVEEPSEEDRMMALFMEITDPSNKYSAARMAKNFNELGEKMDKGTVELLYLFYGSVNRYDESWTMSLEEFVDFLSDNILEDKRFAAFIDDDLRERFGGMRAQMQEGLGRMRGPKHSIAAILTSLPDESPATEAFIRSLDASCAAHFTEPSYLLGESVMFCEMKDGFGREMLVVTLLTILTILAVVAIAFHSIPVAFVLVMTVMSAVFVNVTASGFGGHTLLYLAYLIVQSILMGASIDYGILFTGYYRATRDLKLSYRGATPTILTSGLIMICVPGAMALLLDDAMISPIVANLSLGSLAAVILILFVMPAVLTLMYPAKAKKTKRRK